MMCATEVRNDFANLIRMRWIRPEDLRYYEEIGIDRFKIAGRYMSTDQLVNVIKAYSERKYEGDLRDLFGHDQGRVLVAAFRRLNLPTDEYDILNKISIDNTAFPSNWLSYFKYNRCEETNCEECRYCDIIAEKVVKIDGKPLSEVKLNKIKPPIELIPRFTKDNKNS